MASGLIDETVKKTKSCFPSNAVVLKAVQQAVAAYKSLGVDSEEWERPGKNWLNLPLFTPPKKLKFQFYPTLHAGKSTKTKAGNAKKETQPNKTGAKEKKKVTKKTETAVKPVSPEDNPTKRTMVCDLVFLDDESDSEEATLKPKKNARKSNSTLCFADELDDEEDQQQSKKKIAGNNAGPAKKTGLKQKKKPVKKTEAAVKPASLEEKFAIVCGVDFADESDSEEETLKPKKKTRRSNYTLCFADELEDGEQPKKKIAGKAGQSVSVVNKPGGKKGKKADISATTTTAAPPQPATGGVSKKSTSVKSASKPPEDMREGEPAAGTRGRRGKVATVKPSSDAQQSFPDPSSQSQKSPELSASGKNEDEQTSGHAKINKQENGKEKGKGVRATGPGKKKKKN